MTTTKPLADVALCDEIIVHSSAAGRFADLYLTVLDVEIARDGWVTLEVALRATGGTYVLHPMPGTTTAYYYPSKK